ncbi:hypothetical protein [Herbaspirillum rubrisubalbicans]|uniref:hypothetical protein n=1 Tax=Herbaspirillum rubrisubalbicans TaxID=80842 RepID=UPI001ED99729|nr:hypothetical protein [Herbaspirillum rubrisubalbicans]
MNRHESNGKTFILFSPGDYLEKIRWEFERLKRMDDGELPGYLYQTVNCLSDIWHMCDWVYAAANQGAKPARNGLRIFRESIRTQDRSLAIAREIADAHKHSRVDSSPDPDIGTGYVLGPGPLRKAPTSWFILDGEEWLRPEDVVDSGIRFWSDYLSHHDMLAETPLEEIYSGEKSLL